jgi:hypothetical protein
MKTAAYEGYRLKISAKNCDINIKGGDVKFNLECKFAAYYILTPVIFYRISDCFSAIWNICPRFIAAV